MFNQKKNKIYSEDTHELLENFEPDGRELADYLRNQEEWIKDNPDVNLDDIADYYLAQLNTVNPLHLTVEKTDSEWNQEEYDAIFNRPEDYRSDIYTGRMPDKKP